MPLTLGLPGHERACRTRIASLDHYAAVPPPEPRAMTPDHAPTDTACDIFCAVIDNFGDIGVCWRLARQLASEHGWQVRIFVDDLRAFHALCADVDPALARQEAAGS